MSYDQDGCEWVSFFWYWLTRVVSDQMPLNSCVCVCLHFAVAELLVLTSDVLFVHNTECMF